MNNQPPDAVRTYQLPNGEWVHPHSMIADFDYNHPIEDPAPGDFCFSLKQARSVMRRFFAYVSETPNTDLRTSVTIETRTPDDRYTYVEDEQLLADFIAYLGWDDGRLG